MTDPYNPEVIFNRITEAREAQGLTANALCLNAGLNKDTLATAKRNNGRMDLRTISLLANALDRPLADILGQDLLGLPAEAAETPAKADPALMRLPLDHLAPSHLNPRQTFEDEALKELADSIAAQGLLQNLVVRSAHEGTEPSALRPFVIVAGERRYRALKRLREENRLPQELADLGIPVRVIEADEAGHLALALLENLQRQDVNPMEEADAFAKLQALDPEQWKASTIAERIGTSTRHVQQRLALLSRLSECGQTALRAGKITFTHARALILQPKEQQERTLRETLDRHTSASALHKQITGNLIPTSRAIFDLADYTGEIVEGEKGTTYFQDEKAFRALQKAAVERRAKELGSIWKWCEIIETHYCSLWDVANESSTDTTLAGVRLHMNPETGKVTEHLGLVLKSDLPVDPEQEAANQATTQKEKEKAEAVEQLQSTLRAHIQQSPQIAIALLLENSLSPGSLGADWGAENVLLSFLSRAGINRSGGTWISTDEFQNYLRFMDQTPAPEEILAEWVAARLRLYGGHPLPDLAKALIDHFGVTIPAVLEG